jgi:pimeloyl-ACP methyl ester carboxylesterase
MHRKAHAAALQPSHTIVFSHANGFPAGTYHVLFEAWRAAGFRVLALERFGHDPAYTVTSNWPHLRDELLAFIVHEAPGQSVHLVGHSMGGYVSLLAACRKPGLAQSVTLVDSPVVAGWRAHALHMAKVTGLAPRVGPGHVSARRRVRWASRTDALNHFQSKRAFAAWDPRVLADYIRAGMEDDSESVAASGPGAVRLAFHRDVETRVYNTLPHHLESVLKRHPPRCPVSYLGGTRSPEGRQAGLAATRRIVGHRLAWLDGSHLFPMEQPESTAAAVLQLIEAAAGAPGAAPVVPPSATRNAPA